jgi:hypothetical protein
MLSPIITIVVINWRFDWDSWWKQNWDSFSPITSVSAANCISANCSILLNHHVIICIVSIMTSSLKNRGKEREETKIRIHGKDVYHHVWGNVNKFKTLVRRPKEIHSFGNLYLYLRTVLKL